eukprot:TRINITY_DN9251_c0_g1_i1.p1 TRINITY_DN9251_c0_g1~~TRINITY_DN9251_c0_g1_i1.p1  ORF type:complete len:147 (+),score=21.13 TRINITY_DN9251_c0_g1_i1:47-487(+)
MASATTPTEACSTMAESMDEYLLGEIGKWLSPIDISTMQLVCKRYQQALSPTQHLFWRSLYLRDWTGPEQALSPTTDSEAQSKSWYQLYKLNHIVGFVLPSNLAGDVILSNGTKTATATNSEKRRTFQAKHPLRPNTTHFVELTWT